MAVRELLVTVRHGEPVERTVQSLRDIVAAWTPEAYGEPIVIGQVRIAAGDYILADIDGAVVIPAGLAERAIERCETVMSTENKVRTAILDGMAPQEAYLKWRKF